MIDISLVETSVNLDDFETFNQDRPCLFLGFAIKNEYDNQRLEINDDYNPLKQLFAFEKNGEFKVLPLYGLFVELNDVAKKLANTLLEQEKQEMNINIYSDILDQYNISCRDSYSYLNKNIYPIDFEYFADLTTDKIKDDGKILQHLLELDDNKFDFQKFGAFKLLILV
jgi:hypothetical protein